MAGRLAIDFGTSNTVVALFDAEQGDAVPVILPDYTRDVAVRSAGGDFAAVPVVPSLIHYVAGDDPHRWIGEQVYAHDLYEDPQTFRWMKRYVGRRTPTRLRVGDVDVSAADAGRDFLAAVMTVAAAGMDIDAANEEVALTVPVEAFEHYDAWLLEAAAEAGIARPRLIDEASAAAIGYGAHVQPGDVYLIFDFGGGTMDVSVVLMEEEADAGGGFGGTGDAARRCRVLGKAGSDLGGATLDEWVYQDVLRQAKAGVDDEDVRKVSRKLLIDCERAKETLSVEDRADVSVLDLYTGYQLTAEYTRNQFETMLEGRGLYTQIDRTVRRAMNAARDRGYDDDAVKAVFMLGGSSLIPSVQQVLTRIFGGDRVMIDRPLEAVACGAAAFAAGAGVYDHIQHDYAIRHVNPQTGGYDYRPIVRRGTRYPTAEPVAKVVVKASHAGQQQLGIAVFEVGQGGGGAAGAGPKFEMVFDPAGAARVQEVAPDEADRRTHFWVNEAAPTFLAADPPADPGEPRFEVAFGVDANKRLVLSATDVKSGKVVYQEVPVVMLS
ncbi:MAG: DnaK family protein [Phycisphaerales bacterium]|nr:DnaK family protein [Phycisphaerales bacterium]